MRNVRQWNVVLHAYPSRISHTKCNKHNRKTVNATHLSLDLKGLLERTTWGLKIAMLTNENNTDKISELRELRSVGAPILAGVSPTKQMHEALVEQTMLMDTSIWARNLS